MCYFEDSNVTQTRRKLPRVTCSFNVAGFVSSYQWNYWFICFYWKLHADLHFVWTSSISQLSRLKIVLTSCAGFMRWIDFWHVSSSIVNDNFNKLVVIVEGSWLLQETSQGAGHVALNHKSSELVGQRPLSLWTTDYWSS